MDKKTTQRLTMAQALIAYLCQQFVERDGIEQAFFAGCFGIFGHGIVGGIGQALQQMPALRYYQARNEQAMVHTATAFAKTSNRLRAFACTSSIGPGATNMITGAATATINRLPVLLLPGDIFARRNVAPVLQQLESFQSQDISVNDCFKPVSRYWDRINRPDQLLLALPEALRVLTSPAETGAVTLALPQDVQAEAFDYPTAFFHRRVWRIPRPRPDACALHRAAEWIRASRRPLIVAGGGVIYSAAGEALRALIDQTGIPVGETMAGKGSLAYNHPLNLGAIGATGTFAANRVAKEADLVIGVGTRYSDFTTSSKTAFQDPEVRFININISEFDAGKHNGLAVSGDARAALEELAVLVQEYKAPEEYRAQAQRLNAEWDAEVERLYATRLEPLPSQAELLGAINELSGPDAIMVNAAGSMPGDLHKLWRARHPKNFHMEYGNSCMGYEIAGGLGAKMAAPERDVYVIVGDGSYLMLSSEIVTSIQEGYKLIIILLDNSGFKSIGSLSRSLGQDGFGTRFVFPGEGGLAGDSAGENVQTLAIDFAQNARSLGAEVFECASYADFTAALADARKTSRTTLIAIKNDRYHSVPGYESWWDVQVAEVSSMPAVQEARTAWEEMRAKERFFFKRYRMNPTPTLSPLHQMAATTPTDYWNDSCSIEELTYAIENGAVGATSNPSIVLDVLKKEMALWRERIQEIISGNPTWNEDQIAWKIIEELAVKGAELLLPVFEREEGRKGRLSIQTNPTYYRDAEAILAQALNFNRLAPNMQIKIPVTQAGVRAIEEATYRGININATVCFCVPQSLAVAEAVERGLKQREAEGQSVKDLHPVCTIMVGRMDDWIHVLEKRDAVLVPPGTGDWAGIACLKKAYGIYQERGYRTRLLAAAYRHHLHWSELIGGDIIMTIPSPWQRLFNASHIPVVERFDCPVPAEILATLLAEFPDFQRAYAEDGLSPAEFDSFGPSARTLRAFISSYRDLLGLVRDFMLPNPDII